MQKPNRYATVAPLRNAHAKPSGLRDNFIFKSAKNVFCSDVVLIIDPLLTFLYTENPPPKMVNKTTCVGINRERYALPVRLNL